MASLYCIPPNKFGRDFPLTVPDCLGPNPGQHPLELGSLTPKIISFGSWMKCRGSSHQEIISTVYNLQGRKRSQSGLPAQLLAQISIHSKWDSGPSIRLTSTAPKAYSSRCSMGAGDLSHLEFLWTSCIFFNFFNTIVAWDLKCKIHQRWFPNSIYLHPEEGEAASPWPLFGEGLSISKDEVLG